MLESTTAYLESLISLLGRLPLPSIQDVIDTLAYARFSNRQVIVMGNGGSAATASHFACDLGKGTLMPGLPRFRVLALTDNMPLFSALANDYGYDHVFSEQLKSLVQPGDVVIGISGSGNSPNVLNAIQAAREARAITIGFVGFDGGLLKGTVDICVHASSDCMEQVEDVHLILEHLISTSLRQVLDEAQFTLPHAVQRRLDVSKPCASSASGPAGDRRPLTEDTSP
jgi:D-sedoheptulose 7-phosphate isomerase